MKAYRRPFSMLVLLAAVGAALSLGGCSQPPREAAGRMDTPDHHALRGNDFLDRGDLDNATRSFDMALSLDKDFSPALAGKAVTTALQSAAPDLKADQRRKLAGEADDLAVQARKRSKNDDERRGANVAAVRVQRIAKPSSSWLREAESAYKDALNLDPRRLDADPHYFMAQAYRDAFDLQRAGDLYREVLRMNRGRAQAADTELAIVQKILRAEPGSRHGKAVAFESAMSRSDISALLVEELQLAKLYERGNAARFDTGFRAPEQGGMQADQLQRIPDVTDIKDHPLRSDIQEVLRLKVVGLEANADHKFHPNAKITRAEFALIVEDVLARVTGEQKLKTRFIGQASPFPDVRNDAFFFNAVQTVTSRNLMEPKNKIQGIFGPQDPVSGADALIVLRLLKDELRSLVRS